MCNQLFVIYNFIWLCPNGESIPTLMSHPYTQYSDMNFPKPMLCPELLLCSDEVQRHVCLKLLNFCVHEPLKGLPWFLHLLLVSWQCEITELTHLFVFKPLGKIKSWWLMVFGCETWFVVKVHLPNTSTAQDP